MGEVGAGLGRPDLRAVAMTTLDQGQGRGIVTEVLLPDTGIDPVLPGSVTDTGLLLLLHLPPHLQGNQGLHR